LMIMAKSRIKPNFLFIGPDKTGSSWLYYVLRNHPRCFVPPAKDIWFFDKYYDRGMDWYLSFFEGAPEKAEAIGELSHDYLFSPQAAGRIAKDLPEVKLLTCLRDPVERTFSQYLYLKRSGITKAGIERAIEEYPRLIDNSLYYKHLSTYYDRFPRERIKVLWFSDLKEDSEEFARQVFDFLEIAHAPHINYEKRVRPAGEPRSFYLARALKWAGLFARQFGLSNLVGRVKSSGLINGLFYRPFQDSEKPELGEEMEKELRSRFEADIRSLEGLLEVDLARWYGKESGGRSTGEGKS